MGRRSGPRCYFTARAGLQESFERFFRALGFHPCERNSASIPDAHWFYRCGVLRSQPVTVGTLSLNSEEMSRLRVAALR